MKKLLVLMLVLGVASVATAGLQISFEGNPDPVDTEIWMDPSQIAELDIHGQGAGTGDYVYYMLLVDQAEGTITGSDAGVQWGSLSKIDYFTNEWPTYYLDPWIGRAGYSKPPMDGIAGYVGDSSGAGFSGLLVDGIMFHCEGPQDAVIKLLVSDTNAAGSWTLEDQLIIHQVPEPITMGLLAVGGLFLRRRK